MQDKRLAKRFGVTIRRLRLLAGLSQEAFAERCGLHRTYVGSIERGEKTVTIETANKLAEALGLSLVRLFQEAEKEPTSVHSSKRS
jgi:transcriptional regulator with XRE-family HTH domain